MSTTGELLTCASFDITLEGLTHLLTILTDTGMVIDRVGVEGSSSLGLPVVAALRTGGYDVREVQASRTNDRRRRRHRAKTDITDAHAIATETLADTDLPPARKHAEPPSPVWETLRVLRSQRESLVLQRVRLLNEAEPVLCALPIDIRDQLPATSRVMTALKTIRTLDLDRLGRADTARVGWLRSTLAAIEAINGDLKGIDAQVPAF